MSLLHVVYLYIADPTVAVSIEEVSEVSRSMQVSISACSKEVSSLQSVAPVCEDVSSPQLSSTGNPQQGVTGKLIHIMMKD